MKVIKIEEPHIIKGSHQVKKGNKPHVTAHGKKLEIDITTEDYIQDHTKAKNKYEIIAIEDKAYKKYSLKEFQDKILHVENIWAIYKFAPEDWELLYKDRQRYEGFASGFLQYYDSEVRNGMIDHEIFFHWGKWNEEDNQVVIFIYPKPMTEPLQITDYADRIGNKYIGGIREVEPPIYKASDPPKVPPPPPPY